MGELRDELVGVPNAGISYKLSGVWISTVCRGMMKARMEVDEFDALQPAQNYPEHIIVGLRS